MTVARGSNARDFARVEFREPKHAASGKQHAVHGDEQAVDVIDRQRVQQHVATGETPGVDQRKRIAAEVPVRQHRALRAAGRARRVDDRREVVRPRRDGVERFLPSGRAIEERAFAVTERQDGRLRPQRRDGLRRFGPADDDARLGVTEEIGELALLVARVERKVDEPGPQAAEVEGERFPALVDLRRDPVADPAAFIVERVGDLRRYRVEPVVMDDRPVRDEDARLPDMLVEMTAQERVEIGVHAGERTGPRRGADLVITTYRVPSTLVVPRSGPSTSAKR